MFFSKNNLIF